MAVNQLKVGAVLNYSILILNTLVNLLYTPYMLRMMGQSEYGLYSIVASVIGYLTILDLGFGNAIIRYTAKYRAEGKSEEQYKMFGMFFALYFIIGIVAFGVGLGLYYNVDSMFGDSMTELELDHARIMMLILVFNLAFTFPMSIFGSIMSAYERFVFPKIVNIVRIILNTLIMIILLSQGFKAIAMVCLMTSFNVITLILNFIYCKTMLNIKFIFGQFEWGFLKEVFVYSLWIFLNAIMDKVYWSTGQFVLGSIAGTIAVSIFSIAIHLQGMYMQFSTAIASVFLPKITGMVVNGDNRKDISNLFIRTGRIQNLILFMVLMGFLVFGQQFINLWAGEEYASAYFMTVAFFVALYIPLIQNLGITILQARNQMKFRSLLYIVIASLALIVEIILAKKWGGFGCAIAISGALLLGQGLIMNIYYKRKQGIDITLFWKEIFKMNLFPLVLSGVFFLLMRMYICVDSWKSFVSWISIYFLLYLIIVVSFSMNKYERSLLFTPLLRCQRK